MLEETFADEGLFVEDDDCGCWVTTILVDGVQVAAHHWIPDDTAPHIPDSQCGCQPVLRGDAAGGVLLYEHLDQDDPELAVQPYVPPPVGAWTGATDPIEDFAAWAANYPGQAGQT